MVGGRNDRGSQLHIASQMTPISSVRFALIVAFLGTAAHSSQGAPAKPFLQVAAVQFAVTPENGAPSDLSATGQTLTQVIGDLKSTITLIEYGDDRLCLLASPLPINAGKLYTAVRLLIAKELALSPNAVVCSCAHDHTIPLLIVRNPEAWGKPGDYPPVSESNQIARQFLVGVSCAARGLDRHLKPVTVEWGTAKEDRVTYNRRGRRSDGTSYFIREEDRVKLAPDYVGKIDNDASVVVFRGVDSKPVAAFAFFTGHPVTGYNPEAPVSFGQWPQVACEKLSRYLGGVPVAFLQGSAGDINSKYMLSGTIAQAVELGGYLGDSYIKAAGALHPSKRTDFQWKRDKVGIPLNDLPDIPSLERDLASIDDFIRRGRAGNPNTLSCVGMNFPLALSPPYRATLVMLVRPWYVWALDQRRTGAAASLPKTLPLEIVVARIGDVGFVGMPFEAFVSTGLKIKTGTPLPCVLPCCYIDGMQGYIPDAASCDDREYQAGYFRYLGTRPPYRSPGGDAAATVAIATLGQFAE